MKDVKTLASMNDWMTNKEKRKLKTWGIITVVSLITLIILYVYGG